MTEKKYRVRNVTPEAFDCGGMGCPAIYEGIREITPKEMDCVVGSCPSAYEATRGGNAVYLIIGKQIVPSEAGLEKKVGEGEVLVEVSRALIDKMRK